MNWRLTPLFAALLLTAATTLQAQTPAPPQTSENNEELRAGLKRFPEADTNKDGILTLEEAHAFIAKQKAAGEAAKSNGIKPSMVDVPYGPHARNVLDFWVSKSSKPAPLVIFIHGGGFRAGSKESSRTDPKLAEMLKSGMACAAINYRFLDSAPVQTILMDCAHAVQFLRSKAPDWNINKTRIAAVGGSAGAGTSLWLATHEDIANPNSSNPVLRESSRICCAALFSTQATYDVTKWESFLGTPEKSFWTEGEVPLFYGMKTLADLKSPEGSRILHECDMLAWISKDSAPLFMDSSQDVPKPTNRGEWLHTTQHARTVKKQFQDLGVECVLVQDETEPKPTVGDFLRKHLAGK